MDDQIPTPPSVVIVWAMPVWADEWRVMAVITDESTADTYKKQLEDSRLITEGSARTERLPMQAAFDLLAAQ